MKSDLTGTVSLVTGAARGIGKAIADRLAANGSRVYYTDRDGADVRLDVTDPAEIASVAARVEAEAGRLDVLVNNAGINTLAHRVTIDEFPRAEWDRILAVDLTGVYEVSRAFAPLLRRHKGGRIINIASIAGLVPLRLQCAFVAAKAGVVNLTRAMALELGPADPGECMPPGPPRPTRQLFYGEDGCLRIGPADAGPRRAGAAGRGGRDRGRRPVPGRPGEHVHDRARPGRGWRVDGGLCPRLLTREIQ